MIVPPSGEVIAEEIEVKLAEGGMPRDEQGPLIRGFVRTLADELAKVTQAAYHWARDE